MLATVEGRDAVVDAFSGPDESIVGLRVFVRPLSGAVVAGGTSRHSE